MSVIRSLGDLEREMRAVVRGEIPPPARVPMQMFDSMATMMKVLSLKYTPVLAYTDYPMDELGEEEFTKAPIRAVYILDYDNNKYCDIMTVEEGVRDSIKRGYLFTSIEKLKAWIADGHSGDTKCISHGWLASYFGKGDRFVPKHKPQKLRYIPGYCDKTYDYTISGYHYTNPYNRRAM